MKKLCLALVLIYFSLWVLTANILADSKGAVKADLKLTSTGEVFARAILNNTASGKLIIQVCTKDKIPELPSFVGPHYIWVYKTTTWDPIAEAIFPANTRSIQPKIPEDSNFYIAIGIKIIHNIPGVNARSALITVPSKK